MEIIHRSYSKKSTRISQNMQIEKPSAPIPKIWWNFFRNLKKASLETNPLQSQIHLVRLILSNLKSFSWDWPFAISNLSLRLIYFNPNQSRETVPYNLKSISSDWPIMYNLKSISWDCSFIISLRISTTVNCLIPGNHGEIYVLNYSFIYSQMAKALGITFAIASAHKYW